MLSLSRARSALALCSRAMLYMALFMLVLLTALVLAQIICRNVFDLGLPWADELARFCGVALVFLAIPYLLIEDKHIAMDLVPNMLPRTGKMLCESASRVLMIGFCAIVLWALYKFLLRAAKFSTPALGIPNLVFYMPAILGFAFFALIALYKLLARHGSSETHQEHDA